MRNSRLGCLTPFGLFASLMTLLVIGGIYVLQGGTMFSPGALSAASGPMLAGVTSHAELGGRCTACHTPPWSVNRMTDRCLDCHTRVRSDLADPTTLHGALASPTENVDCRQCHTEHRGPDAILTTLDNQNFPHDVTGFSLLAHAEKPDRQPFECADCHNENLAGFRPEICANCHERLDAVYINRHTASFGQKCLACHDGVDIFSNFNHDLTPFALSGKHTQVLCQGCHEGSTSRQELQETATDCISCHMKDDPHHGQFGPNCAQCHTPQGWTPATFDHSLSIFPLTGAHQSVSCAGCHINSVYKGTPTQCAACHTDSNFHHGLFGSDCAACHNTSGWLTVNYDRPHSFPQSHGDANSCRDCHPSTLGTWTCYTCHNQAEISKEHTEEGIGDFNNCLRCHPNGLEGDDSGSDEREDDD